jgi:ankyrin repeat protein
LKVNEFADHKTGGAPKAAVLECDSDGWGLLHVAAFHGGVDIATLLLDHGKKAGFLSHLYIKVIFLPRQARDKHRESTHSRKSGVLSKATKRFAGWRSIRRVRTA